MNIDNPKIARWYYRVRRDFYSYGPTQPQTKKQTISDCVRLFGVKPSEVYPASSPNEIEILNR